MKAWRSVAALGLAAGAAVSVGAWGQQGTPSQQPRQNEGTRSPSRQEQPPPRQDERERRDSRDRDRDQNDRDQDSRDRRDGAFDDDDDDDNRNDRDMDGRRTRNPRDGQDDPNDRAFRRRAGALDDPRRDAEFNRSLQRLESQERELLQRNQDLLRRLGEARALSGDQRIEALAAVIQDSLLEQERVLRYLADARGAFAGDVSPGDRTGDQRDDDDDGTLRQDNQRDDRRTPLERETDDRGRDDDRRQPGRTDQPRPTNPR